MQYMKRVVNEICERLPLLASQLAKSTSMMASLEDNVVELSSKLHQPRKFKFPKTEYGNKVRLPVD